MTGFLFDPVYKLSKIENSPNSSALGRKTKPYKAILQLLWRAGNREKCGMKEELVEEKEKVTRLPRKTLVYSVFLTHSWTGEEGEEWACQQANKHSPVCVFSVLYFKFVCTFCCSFKLLCSYISIY